MKFHTREGGSAQIWVIFTLFFNCFDSFKSAKKSSFLWGEQGQIYFFFELKICQYMFEKKNVYRFHTFQGLGVRTKSVKFHLFVFFSIKNLKNFGNKKNIGLFRGNLKKNKPKMAYSRDLPKMAVMDDHG